MSRSLFVAMVLALSLPSCGGADQSGHVAGTEFGGEVKSRDPAILLAVLANAQTPTASRESADRLLVEQKGKTDEARLAVLEQIIFAPGHADVMRIYAMDQLVDADPARAERALMLYLPKLEGEPLKHAAEAALKLGDERMTEPLVLSLGREEGLGAEEIGARPEAGAIAKLSSKDLDAALVDVLRGGRDPSARIAAADVLFDRVGEAEALRRIEAIENPDVFVGDLQWYGRTFSALPYGPTEFLWVKMLRRPENGALVDRAAEHHRMLVGQKDYRFAPRFAAVLAYSDPATLRLSRDDLMNDLRSRLAALPHAGRAAIAEGVRAVGETLEAHEKELSRGDLLALRLVLGGLTPAALSELHRQGLDDLSDTATEHGGLAVLENIHAPTLAFNLYPPLFTGNDLQYTTGDKLLQETVTGIAQYHFHFQQIHNGDRAGPGDSDLAYVRRTRTNALVITSVDTRKMDINFYTPAGAVIDLGVYEVKP